ncbi:unnamed protein product [Penicillium roqueforti FM164]|uniref:Genomic scaffold, ProqFM164S02 n=1 Tax=Penicillium roqueforti (strain FM164) TaxID=1365484 RepID=W6Q3R8_PENRF|nr:unnamed protein product [Penicillium roqueforti FM164]
MALCTNSTRERILAGLGSSTSTVDFSQRPLLNVSDHPTAQQPPSKHKHA